MSNIKEIFENKIKIDSKVVTIDSLFNNDDRLDNTNFKPAYQRNYVWDDEKATYFIESILLGTEIPPLIYFRNISKVEIIDGRQRYETILRFIKGDFKLKKKGLKILVSKEFTNKNFDTLDLKYKELFYETKLRIIEFSFFSRQGIDEIIEDNIKIEIFKRYNSGITPLKNTDIEKAEFLFDNVNTFFKENIFKDNILKENIKTLFYFERGNDEILLKKIRELLIISNIPIRYFANKKSNIINSYYDYVYSDPEQIDFKNLKISFIQKINLIKKIYNIISSRVGYNRLISECLFWGFSILERDKSLNIIEESHIKEICNYLVENMSFFDMDRSSFSKNIYLRYESISKLFKNLFNIDFETYLNRSEEFNNDLQQIDNLHNSEEKFNFDDLRLNKTEPSSFSIDDIIRSIQRQKFIIRPQYQRNEVIDRKKRSSLIESILLGIKLPPLFIFKKLDGVSEVIDGQQRLLSILGYLGNEYLSDTNEMLSSKYENFSLSLKNGILSDLHGSKFSDLSTEYQEKIKNFDLWIIEIDQRYNREFDPIDLFLRLNYKPYPIKLDSFEMWNSYIDRNLINTVKDIYNNHKDWLYQKKSSNRMENENVLTALIYLYYEYSTNLDNGNSYKALDYYKIGNKINFRLRSKNDLTKKLETVPNELQFYCNKFEINFIYKLLKLIKFQSNRSEAHGLDYILSIDNGRRTQQSLYALWYFFNEVPSSIIDQNADNILDSVRNLFRKMTNVESIKEFDISVKMFKDKYSEKFQIIEQVEFFNLSDIAIIAKGFDKNKIEYSDKVTGDYLLKNVSTYSNTYEVFGTKNIKRSTLNQKFFKSFVDVDKIIFNANRTLFYPEILLDRNSLFFDSSYFGIVITRPEISYKYIFVLLSSSINLDMLYEESEVISINNIGKIKIPLVNLHIQNLFDRMFDLLVEEDVDYKKNYYLKIKNEIVFGLYNKNLLKSHGFDFNIFIDQLQHLFSELNLSSIYEVLSDKDSIVTKYLLLLSTIKRINE